MATKVQPKRVGKKNPFRIINRALRDARVKNLGVVSKNWGVEPGPDGRWRIEDDSCACPLGLCLVGKKCRVGDTQEVAATRVLGKPIAWVRSFIDGIDGGGFALFRGEKQAYNFGQRVRAKYISA